MGPWKIWKSGFDRWEKTTAAYLDKTLRNPALLGPSASLLNLLMQSKSGADQAMAMCWRTLGLPSQDAQDRAMHRINQLEGRILDLEEELRELRGE